MLEELIPIVLPALIGAGSALLVAYLTARRSKQSRIEEQKDKLLELLGQIEHQFRQAGAETEDIERVIKAVSEVEQEGFLAYAIGFMSGRLTEVTELVSERRTLEAELETKQAELAEKQAEEARLEAEKVKLQSVLQVAKAYGTELMEDLEEIPPTTPQAALERGKLRAGWENIVAQINQHQPENEHPLSQADERQECEDN